MLFNKRKFIHFQIRAKIPLSEHQMLNEFLVNKLVVKISGSVLSGFWIRNLIFKYILFPFQSKNHLIYSTIHQHIGFLLPIIHFLFFSLGQKRIRRFTFLVINITFDLQEAKAFIRSHFTFFTEN